MLDIPVLSTGVSHAPMLVCLPAPALPTTPDSDAALAHLQVVLVLPNMKMDPGEYKAMMEERNQRSSGVTDAQEALAAQQPAAAALPAARGPQQRSGGSRRR